MPRWQTIRQTARTLALPEYVVRTKVKCGEVPGFRQGNRFYCDVQLLAQMLEQESRAAVANAPEEASR